MKLNFYLLLVLLFSANQNIFAQLITSTLNDTICCSNDFGEKKIDIDEDGIDEIRIFGKIFTDVAAYRVDALSSNVKVSSATHEGDNFQTFSDEGEIATAGVACLWFDYTTGDPNKFIGVQQIEGTDTLWSYIEIEFSEEDPNDGSCWDSRIIALNSVQNTIPNQRMFAGGILSSILENEIESDYRIYPSPASQYVNLPLEFLTGTYQIFDVKGKEIIRAKLENSILDISNLDAGIYFFRLEKEKKVIVSKIIIK